MSTTHAQKLERWLGAEQVEAISRQMVPWYGPPIAMQGVPGAVYSARGGDFVGPILGGGFASLADYLWERGKRIARNTAKRQQHRARTERNTGFSSLSDIILEATTGGKRQDRWFSKASTLATTGAVGSLWNVGNFPSAGATPSAIPGGSVPTNATAGSFEQVNPGGSDTLHLTTFKCAGSAAPNTIMLYDRTFHASSVQHNTTSGQTVSGTPSRYATTTSPGVFAFLEVTTALGATAQNLVMTYTDEAGNTAEAAAAVVMTALSVVNRIPHPLFFIPLNSGDIGLRTITNLAFSAASTGVSNVVMGKPLAWISMPTGNLMELEDGINSAFNLVEILTNACLAMIELKGVSTATTYTGNMVMVSG